MNWYEVFVTKILTGRELFMKKRLIAFLLVLVLLAPAAVAAAVTYYRVNTSSLKLRLLPRDNATVLDSFREDFALTVQKKLGDWSYVTFTNGSEGYVQNRYLATSRSYKAYITADDTPIRKGPNYNYANVGKLARGAKVTVLTHGNKYDYVSSSIGKGYVLNARLSKKYVKPSGKKSVPASQDVNYTAWIVNASGKVNLRTGPSKSARVIDSYPSGTMVTVRQHNPVWDYVEVDDKAGYMMNSYLSKDKPAPTPTVQPTATPFVSYTAYITSPNQEGVNVRRHAGKGYAAIVVAPYGAQITVLSEGSKWFKIQYQKYIGYVERQFVQLTPPAPTATPAPTVTVKPTPAPTPFAPYWATITCPEGEKVNVRAGEGKGYTHLVRLDPGTEVEVIALGKKYPATWAKVRYGKIEGYVMLKYLKKIKLK